MIWNDRFIWLHFPKCAGTKTEHIFRRYFSHRSDIHQDVVDVSLDPTVSWHDSLSERERRDREFFVGNRTIICPIRRLPSWLESRFNFEVARSPHLAHDPESLLRGNFLFSSGKEGHADQVARRYLPPSILASANLLFIHQEHFAEDFCRVFSPFIDVALIPPEEFLVRENSAPSSVPPEISERLRSQELFRYCPAWQDVEKTAYSSKA